MKMQSAQANQLLLCSSSADSLGGPSEQAPPKETQDQWLGVASGPSRAIENTPYFVSRLGHAAEPAHQGQRLNRQGYDADNPADAIIKYERAHPEPLLSKIWNEFTDALFNLFSACVPKALSLSAGEQKQRIDQRVVLNIVRQAVDKFPELKIRISKEAFSLMNVDDQRRFHEMMAIIRAAQHDYIINELAKVYPGHIDQHAPTLLYTGGRATGLLRVLYCSVDEYIALYWSDWGLMSTDSGSYKSHVYDYITEGQNINWHGNPESFDAKDFEITEPGEYTFLGKGDRKIWSFEGPCGMVDHGIGDVISMTKFALVSNFTSTLNMEQVGKLISTESLAVAREYAQRMKDAFGCEQVMVKEVSQVSAQQLADARNYFSRITAKVEELDNSII